MLRPDFPQFRYHPDPIASGSVVVSDQPCFCCGKTRGFLYTVGVYGDAPEELQEAICPWCIADGSVGERWSALFNVLGGTAFGDWSRVPKSAQSEVELRTPGFASWQDGGWWAHCDDAAAFVAPVGRREVEALGAELVEAFRENSGIEPADWEEHFSAMSAEGNPTGYLFQCVHCGAYGGYSDYL